MHFSKIILFIAISILLVSCNQLSGKDNDQKTQPPVIDEKPTVRKPLSQLTTAASSSTGRPVTVDTYNVVTEEFHVQRTLQYLIDSANELIPFLTHINGIKISNTFDLNTNGDGYLLSINYKAGNSEIHNFITHEIKDHQQNREIDLLASSMGVNIQKLIRLSDTDYAHITSELHKVDQQFAFHKAQEINNILIDYHFAVIRNGLIIPSSANATEIVQELQSTLKAFEEFQQANTFLRTYHDIYLSFQDGMFTAKELINHTEKMLNLTSIIKLLEYDNITITLGNRWDFTNDKRTNILINISDSPESILTHIQTLLKDQPIASQEELFQKMKEVFSKHDLPAIAIENLVANINSISLRTELTKFYEKIMPYLDYDLFKKIEIKGIIFNTTWNEYIPANNAFAISLPLQIDANFINGALKKIYYTNLQTSIMNQIKSHCQSIKVSVNVSQLSNDQITMNILGQIRDWILTNLSAEKAAQLKIESIHIDNSGESKFEKNILIISIKDFSSEKMNKILTAQ